MSDVVDLVSSALRRKLLRHGARSLSEPEWHLLRVSHFLNAAEDGTLDRILADSPQAELGAIAEGLAAVGAHEVARRLQMAAQRLITANDPGRGLQRGDAVAAVVAELDVGLARLRASAEAQLLDYAFRQREMAADTAAV
jgi:hypothetical protein